jgi:sugar lactone lactonase YvrE
MAFSPCVLVCCSLGLLSGCGESITTLLGPIDDAAVVETGVADLGHDGLESPDAEPPPELDAARVEPPPPPPTEPPETMQPAPIVGARTHVIDTRVETLAGSTLAGMEDGLGAAARFHNPVGITLGPEGELYVSDFDNDRIRRVGLDGRVTTLASAPGVFKRPFGLLFDDTGRLFVQTDGDPFGDRSYYTATIWNVNPATGTASVVAADIGRTRGLAPLPGGLLLLTDNAWHHVKRLNPETGEMVEVAGSAAGEAGYADGMGPDVRFFRPYGAARLPNGNVVVADARNHCLREVATDGGVTTLAGECGQPGYVDGPADGALFNFPQDVAVDRAGEVFVTDLVNHCIRIVGTDGRVATLAGDGTEGHVDGPGRQARFVGQEGLEVSPDGSTVYVADGDRSEGLPSHFIRVIHRGNTPAAAVPE